MEEHQGVSQSIILLIERLFIRLVILEAGIGSIDRVLIVIGCAIVLLRRIESVGSLLCIFLLRIFLNNLPQLLELLFIYNHSALRFTDLCGMRANNDVE